MSRAQAMTVEIQELRRLVANATPGKWHHHNDHGEYVGHIWGEPHGGFALTYEMTEADAALICAAVNFVKRYTQEPMGGCMSAAGIGTSMGDGSTPNFTIKTSRPIESGLSQQGIPLADWDGK